MEQEFKFVGFWKRLWMVFVDIIILLVYEFIVTITLFKELDFNLLVSVIYLILMFVVPSLFIILIWKLLGATPGKLLGKARIIDIKTNTTPGIGKLLIRYFGYIPSSFVFFLGFVVSGFDSRKQTWHDKIAGTIIVNKNNISNNLTIQPSQKDKIIFLINSILISFVALILIIGTFFLFYDEELNPIISSWQNKQSFEDLNKLNNAFYHLAGFACNLESDSFEVGCEFAELMKNHRSSSSLNIYETSFQEIFDIFNDIIEKNDDTAFAKYQVKIDSLQKRYKVLDNRFENLKNSSTYFQPYSAHYSNDIHITYALVNSYKFRLLSNTQQYLMGNQNVIHKIESDHKFIRWMLEMSDTIIMKIFFSYMEILTLKTYNFLVDNNAEQTAELKLSISTLSRLNTKERSCRFPLKNEYLMHFASFKSIEPYFYRAKFNALMGYILFKIIPNDIDLENFSDNLPKIADLVFTYALFSEYSFKDVIKIFMYNPNKIKNLSYHYLKSAIEISELDAPSYYNYLKNNDIKSDSLNHQLDADFIELMARTDWVNLLKNQSSYHDINGYVNLLKLKSLINEQQITSDQMPIFLETQSDSLFNPYTEEAFKWNPQNSTIYFESFNEDQYNIREIELQL